MLAKLLASHSFHPLLPAAWQQAKTVWLDLSSQNPLAPYFNDENYLKAYVESMLAQHQATLAIGRYNEHRGIYNFAQFQAETEARTLHLGLDLTLPAGTPLYAMLDATVHSFADHAAVGDYGPTLILQHRLHGLRFYTLYGHLSRNSLSLLTVGQVFAAGDLIAHIGDKHENGNWWPHLHLQIIENLEGQSGGYPGVASPATADHYLANCPDPNLMLKL